MSQNSRYPADTLPSVSVEPADVDSGQPGQTDYLLRSRRHGPASASATRSPRHRALLERALASSGSEAPGLGPQASVTRWRVPTGALVILALVLGLVALWPVVFSGGGSSVSAVPVAPSGGAVVPTDGGSPVQGDEAGQGVSTGAATTSVAAHGGSAPVVVHVAGAVQTPGVYELGSGSRVNDAVTAAGGLRDDADTSAINLAAPASDGSQVYIPVQGEAPPSSAGGAKAAHSLAGTGLGTDRGADAAGLVNINTASAEELQTLPKVGPVLAASIISWREQYGGFSSVDELDQVSGIGPATLEALRPLVTV
ncbi:helix-hairpin-helix domain-containing protein [Rothia nasimurium]|uniref:helix-hairpin-helix domain-containing protein n=1 Tax=Rothia nasimurium TaxID=85336 RepID=UPI001F478FFA|nr:helix-hairpin-helix domain-containing protein [Rothia nasimurium]